MENTAKEPKHFDADYRLSENESKDIAAGHVEYKGINTSDVMPGTNDAYEKKVSIMNEALIDLGMKSYQWKVFLTTGFGWFVDNVSDDAAKLAAQCLFS